MQLNSNYFRQRVRCELDKIPEIDATPTKGISGMVEETPQHDKSLNIRPNFGIKGGKTTKSILSLKSMV